MISFQNFSFRYEESKDFTLRGIDMTVQTGEFILLTGRSGCGKTTLIRSLNGLIPHFYPGEIQGDLVMDGRSLLEMKPAQLAGQVGTVFQDPRSQFFMTDTTRELAFGCENMGLPREETIDRIAKAAKDLELADYLNRSIFALSSGEKQLPPVGNGLHARGGLPRPHDLRVQHHVEPAALDELHHGMPQHLFAGDARDFGMAPVQMHDGPFHVGDADPLFEGVKKLIKILLQHYMSVLSL